MSIKIPISRLLEYRCIECGVLRMLCLLGKKDYANGEWEPYPMIVIHFDHSVAPRVIGEAVIMDIMATTFKVLIPYQQNRT